MNIFDVLSHPPMMHAAVVHLPIVLALTGFALLLACGVFEDNNTLRYLAVINFAVLAAATQYAIMSGEWSRAEVPNTQPQAVWDLIDAHDAMAHRVRIMALITLVFVVLALVPHREFRTGMLLLSGLGSFVTILLVTSTAHYGGMLVYNLGVGTALLHEGGAPTTAGGEEALLPVREFSEEEARLVDYRSQVRPLFEQSCVECHKGPTPDGGYDMTSIDNMLRAGEKGGPGVVPGAPDESSIVRYIRGEMQPRMPHKEPPLDPEQLHLIRMWIAAGALPAPEGTPVEEIPAEEAPAPAFDPFG